MKHDEFSIGTTEIPFDCIFNDFDDVSGRRSSETDDDYGTEFDDLILD